MFAAFAAIPEPVDVFLREWVWWTFLNGFSVTLALPGVLLFLVLLLFFRFGSGFGLPRLFWVAEAGPQFMIGLGIGAVVWQVFLAGYVFEEFATNFTVDRPPFCEVRPIRHTEPPVYLPEVGQDHPDFPGRFRHDPASVWSIWRYSGVVVAAALALVGVLALVVLLLQVVGRLVRWYVSGWKPYDRPKRKPTVGYKVWLPLGAVAGWLAMTGITAGVLALPYNVVAKPVGDGLVTWAGWGKAAERRKAVEEHIAGRKPDAQPTVPGASASPNPQAATHRWFAPYTPVYAAFFINFALIALASVVFIILPPAWRLFSPAVGIVLLLNIAVVGAILLSVFPPLAVSGNFVLILLAILVVLAGRSYKFRFPNMPGDRVPIPLAERYHELVEAEAGVTDAPSGEASAGRVYADPTGRATVRPVFSHAVPYPCQPLHTGTKPPLAIISVSGGGARAAAWGMEVLLELERRFLNPGSGRRPVALPYHTRLVVGASGGMIAGSYYVASLAAPGPGGAVNRNPILRATGKETPITSADLLDGVRQDLLTPITHTLVNHDLPALFAPLRFNYDRGQAMEDALKTACRGQLHVPLASLRDGEAAGWRPSLIFAPMLVEDGRQLFISNLDLRAVTQNRAFILGEDDRRSPNDPEGFGLLSRDGVEFFKLFPAATEFTVATAVRMSASFPYVLPGVMLPTNPPRRVVDAGFYDNFGINIAAAWVFNHMEWIEANTSGVVVIQIRDGVSEAGRKREEVRDGFPPLIDRGLHWLTTPPAGLWKSRMASNAFRNDNLLHLLNDFFLARGLPRGFFATVAFEFGGGDEVALNFTLTRDEIQAVESAVNHAQFTDRADALLNWWHARLADPKAVLSLPEIDG